MVDYPFVKLFLILPNLVCEGLGLSERLVRLEERSAADGAFGEVFFGLLEDENQVRSKS